VRITKIPKQRVGDIVYQMIRQGILDQTFRPGERLELDELAGKLDVSVTPVKDAINRLANEGLVEIRARIGTFVSRISAEDLAQTMEIRCALETHAAIRAAELATDRDIRKLKDLCEEMSKSVHNSQERLQHEDLNRRFHQTIVELSDNYKLIELYKSLNAHIGMARVHYASEAWRDRRSQETFEHRRIVECLKHRDGLGMAQALREHIQSAAASLVNDMRKNEGSQ
jgi:GntR family transcriptional regulator, rspAB operon transcriptional repressor